MSSTGIYTPYFYIIKQKSTGMYYAGSRFAKDCDPKELLTKDGYYTSSNTVKSLLKKDGIDSFKILRIKTFESGEQALAYETRFLKKVDAANNRKFLNKHNNDSRLIFFGSEEFIAILSEKYGVTNSMFIPGMIDRIKKSNLEKHGVESTNALETVKDKKNATKLIRYGDQNYNNQIKTKATKLEKYGNANYNNVAKSKSTMMERYGTDSNFKTIEHKDRARTNALIRAVCPHCNKEGQMISIKRWHYDNCKFKE